MRQKYKIDGSEIKRILEMHDRENPNKRIILEQTDNLKQELQELLNNKCFPRGTVVSMTSQSPQYKYAIKLESKKTKGKFRYFFKDYSVYEYDDDATKKNFHRVKTPSGKDAKWVCDEADLNSRIADFKKTGQGGGWMTYDEANTIDPTTNVKPLDLNSDGEGVTWESTTFEGKKYYRAKRGENSACPKYDELVSKRQKDFVDNIRNQKGQGNWQLCGDLDDATKQYSYVEFPIPNSESAFPDGLKMWKPKSDIVKDSGKTQQAEREKIKKLTYDRKQCKRIIQTYWDDYKISEGDLPSYQDKLSAQSCIVQYYDKWGGLFSGEKNYDTIIDVLTGEQDEYEGKSSPKSAPCIDPQTKRTNMNTWRLCSSGYYR